MKNWMPIICTFILSFSLPWTSEAEVISYLVGNSEDVETSTSPGVLMMGGGGDVDDAMKWFLKKSGGGDIVILRASGSDGYNNYLYKDLGVKVDSVESIVFQERNDSFDENAILSIQNAEAIFLAGGDQSRYVQFWKDTPILKALNKHVSQGKPIGGSSAGLAVLGEFSYSAMHKGSLTSGMALKNPFHEYITIENDFLKIPLLEGIFTDSHFTERARLGRLIIFLARTASEFQRSNLWGVGIDEETALLIESDGEGKILSTKDGTVSLIQISPPIPSLEEGVNLTKLQSIVILLGKDSSINLKNLHVDNPLAVEKIQTLENRLERSSEN